MSKTIGEKEISYLKKSPLRQLFKDKHDISVMDSYRNYIEEIDKTINQTYGKLESDFKIAILGEVKAGKSTLINALLKDEVSYTNVLEATAAILEIGYGSEKGIIYYKTGETEEFKKIETLNKFIEQNIDNREFFNKINKIKIYLDKTILKSINIVDTPGISTITEDNAMKTYDYLNQADIFFWVLNVHHIGQRDIMEDISNLSDLGKPIICVVNRIDELMGDPERVKEYIDMELGYIFEDIVCLSAKQAFEGYSKSDLSLIESSKIGELEDIINNSIKEDIDKLEKEIDQNTLKMQLKKDLEVHKLIKNNLHKLHTELDRDIKDLKVFNAKLKNNISNKLDYWVENEIYNDERNILLNDVEIGSINSKFNEFFNEDYLKKLIEEKYTSLSEDIYRQWSLKIANLQTEDRFSSEENIYDIDERVLFGNDTKRLATFNENKDSEKVSIYKNIYNKPEDIFFGAAAVWLIVGNLALSTIPGALFLAGIGGMFSEKSKESFKRKVLYKNVEEQIFSIRKNIKSQVLSNMRQQLYKYSDTNYESTLESLEKVFLKDGLSKKELRDLNNDLDYYIQNSYYF